MSIRGPPSIALDAMTVATTSLSAAAFEYYFQIRNVRESFAALERKDSKLKRFSTADANRDVCFQQP